MTRAYRENVPISTYADDLRKVLEDGDKKKNKNKSGSRKTPRKSPAVKEAESTPSGRPSASRPSTPSGRPSTSSTSLSRAERHRRRSEMRDAPTEPHPGTQPADSTIADPKPKGDDDSKVKDRKKDKKAKKDKKDKKEKKDKNEKSKSKAAVERSPEVSDPPFIDLADDSNDFSWVMAPKVDDLLLHPKDKITSEVLASAIKEAQAKLQPAQAGPVQPPSSWETERAALLAQIKAHEETEKKWMAKEKHMSEMEKDGQARMTAIVARERDVAREADKRTKDAEERLRREQELRKEADAQVDRERERRKAAEYRAKQAEEQLKSAKLARQAAEKKAANLEASRSLAHKEVDRLAEALDQATKKAEEARDKCSKSVVEDMQQTKLEQEQTLAQAAVALERKDAELADANAKLAKLTADEHLRQQELAKLHEEEQRRRLELDERERRLKEEESRVARLPPPRLPDPSELLAGSSIDTVDNSQTHSLNTSMNTPDSITVQLLQETFDEIGEPARSSSGDLSSLLGRVPPMSEFSFDSDLFSFPSSPSNSRSPFHA